MMTHRVYSDPQPTAETQAFWDATTRGEFLVKTCAACGKAHWYPRTRCPFCMSDKTEWLTASGKGTIYSYSVMRRADPVYVMAYVTLAEGPTMMTNLVDCDPEALTIGDPVQISFQQTTGSYALPMFTPKTGDER